MAEPQACGDIFIDWSALESRSLYGRDDSLLQLSQAYDRCLGGDVEQEIVIITGPSGVGKTALASSLKQRVAESHGFFIAGKFDQVAATNHLTAKSYGPFVEAITDYVKQVVKAGTSVIASVRAALQQDMSTSELHVLLETVPPLNQILRFRRDEHTRDIVLRGTDAEERFIYIFCKFIQTITSQGYPIVLLLDDIQWMNPNAFSLMKGFASMEKTTGSRLLIICACRNDDRVSLDRLCELENGVCRRAHIELSNISLNEVRAIVSDVLLVFDQDKVIWIADVIYSRTQGNPFHMLQLLKVFEREGLMLNSPGQISEGNIDSKSPTVLQLLDMRIERLPNKVKDVLKVAACLGCVFADVCLVAGVFLSESEILSAIRTSESEGIIVSTDAHTYRFTHDKFQQTTYMLIPDEEKDAFHLDVGLRLWHWLPLESRDQYLPLMGDQISRALGLVKDKEERENLAHLFLLAGKKAAKSSSFAAAAAYLKCGIDLLNTKHWKDQYKLSLTLHNAAAEIEYYCGNFDRVDVLVGNILSGAQSYDDTLIARFTRIYCLGSRCEMTKGFNEGVEVLKELGEPLPSTIKYPRVQVELSLCKWMLRRTSERTILELPLLTDKKKLTAMRMMIIMHPLAFNRGNEYGPILAARVVRIILTFGMSELGSAGFAICARYFAIRGDLDESYRCSRYALCIFSKYQSTEWQARIAVTVYAYAFPLKHSLRGSVDALFEGHRSGLVSGDLHFSMLSAFYYCMIRFYAGDPIPEVLDAAKGYRKLCHQYGQHFASSHFDSLIQLATNFMGDSSDPVVLTGDAMKEEDAFKDWQPNNPISFLFFLNLKHFAAVYLNHYDLAKEMANRIKVAKAKLPPIALVTHHFLQAVGSATVPEQRLFLSKLRDSARHCPDNFLHKVYLLEAELANRMGNYDEALTKYEMSIAQAKRQGFVHEQALACERAGYAMRGQGEHDGAKHFLTLAQSAYEQWGAHVKADQLAKELERQTI